MKELSDIILIDKPKGITSFDVIRQLRKKLDIKKIGHAGTLDPLATGLMVLGIGAGTKKLTDYIKLDKEYIADILLGESRTTGDMEGEVVEESEIKEELEILQSKISNQLSDMIGQLELPVSAYSAIKVDGMPMYKRARQAEKSGEVVSDVPVRIMLVYEAELLNLSIFQDKAIVKVRFKVGSGTYIRSLAEELGKRLGYPATLYDLRRTKVGDFDITKALSLDEIK